jgi:signal peptidase I
MSSPRGLRWSLLLIAGAAAALAGWRRLDVVTVRGTSMAPTLLPGERLLVVRRRGAPRVGDVVLAADPRDPERELVKRVAVVRDGEITLRGDSPAASTDSRVFGALEGDGIEWRVFARYWPPLRIGRVLPGEQAPPPLEAHELGGEPACAFPESLIAGE